MQVRAFERYIPLRFMFYLSFCLYIMILSHRLWKRTTNTLVNVYVDLVVFTRIAGTS